MINYKVNFVADTDQDHSGTSTITVDGSVDIIFRIPVYGIGK